MVGWAAMLHGASYVLFRRDFQRSAHVHSNRFMTVPERVAAPTTRIGKFSLGFAIQPFCFLVFGFFFAKILLTLTSSSLSSGLYLLEEFGHFKGLAYRHVTFYQPTIKV